MAFAWTLFLFLIGAWMVPAVWTANEIDSSTPPPMIDLCTACDCPSSLVLEGTVDCSAAKLVLLPPWPACLLRLPGNLSLVADFNLLRLIAPFPPVTGLAELSINHNRVEAIAAQAFAQLTSLRSLSLNNNRLARIHQSAFQCDSGELPLEFLDLSYNRLHTLDEDLFDALGHLRTLLLNDNPLTVLDASTQSALNSLQQLDTLSLAQTDLEELPNLVNPIRHLRVLFLDGNRLAKVPEVLRTAVRLEGLGLNDNPIEQLREGDLEGLGRLERLNVSSMPEMRRVGHGAFAPLENLRSLYCSHNTKLDSISPEAFRIGDRVAGNHLYHVSFRENQLETLSGTLLPWQQIQWVDLQDNPWRCDCRIRWMKKLRSTAWYETYLTCSSPEELLHRHVLNVSEEWFARCPEDVRLDAARGADGSSVNVAIVIVICVTVLGFAIGIAFATHLVQRRRSRAKSGASVIYSKAHEEDYFD